MAELAVSDYKGPRPETLRENRRRLGKAYTNGAFTDQEYELRLAEIDQQLELVGNVATPVIEEAIELFSDIPVLWNEATPEERRKLINTIVEMVYVNLETKQVTGLRLTPAFHALLGNAIDTIPEGPVQLIPSDKTEIVGDGGDGGESNSPSRRCRPRICYKLSRLFVLAQPSSADRVQSDQSIAPLTTLIDFRVAAPRLIVIRLCPSRKAKGMCLA